MNRDFNMGRMFERREACVLVAQVLSEPDPERRELMLKQWLLEAAETLHAPSRRVLFIEDTLVIV